MHPVLIDLGSIRIGNAVVPIQIGSYGFFFVLSFLFAHLIVRRLGKRYDHRADWGDFLWPAMILGFFGAKLANLLVFLPQILRGEKNWFGVLMGGGVWLGGVIPAYFYALWWVRRRKLEFGNVANVLGVTIPAAHGLGRLGCFFAGCCFGAPTDGSLSVTFTNELAHRVMGTPLNVPLHPTQLYEFGLEWFNAGLAFLLWRRGMPQWLLTGLWMSLYGVQRFFVEFLRDDPRGGFGPFSVSQWISLLLVVGGVPLTIWAWRKNIPETFAKR